MRENDRYDISLAADIQGRGLFTPVGVLLGPSIALRKAIDALRKPFPQEIDDFRIYALASRVAGRCKLTDPATQSALVSCQQANLAFEWQLEFGGLGHLKALFTIHSLDDVPCFESIGHLSLRLAGIPTFHLFSSVLETSG